MGVCRVIRRPGTPAFWSASVSEADQRRTIGVIARVAMGRTATTPMERRRPPSEPVKMHRNALPRGLPGSAIVWIVPRSRKVVPAQWRARHAPVWRHMSADPGMAPARPVGRHMPADSGATPAHPGERLLPRAFGGNHGQPRRSSHVGIAILTQNRNTRWRTARRFLAHRDTEDDSSSSIRPYARTNRDDSTFLLMNEASSYEERATIPTRRARLGSGHRPVPGWTLAAPRRRMSVSHTRGGLQ